MDITAFNEAQEAYAAGDYARALAGFSVCTRDLDDLTPAEVSKFYHLIGNCYIKSGLASRAADYYVKALSLSPEDRKPSLYVNLGTALLSEGRFSDALKSFSAALEFDRYPTPYKAWSGIGAAQLKLGDMTEAGAAYREAALDPTNPSPAKALVNLGVCFMELDRADDAITSYEAALDLGLQGQARGKAYANLGQAYMTQGRVTDAIQAFEEAEANGDYELSSIAKHDLDVARLLERRFGSSLEGTAFQAKRQEADEELEAAEEFGQDMTAESGETNELSPEEEVLSPSAKTVAFEPVYTDGEPEEGDSEDDGYHQGESYAGWLPDNRDNPFAGLETDEDAMPSPEDTNFFSADENLINQQAAAFGKHKKKKKHKGIKRFFIALVIIIVLAAAAAAAAYVLGYGYPTQETVTQEFIAAVHDGKDTSDYWDSSVDESSRTSQELALADVDSCEVVSVDRTMQRTVVYVKAKLSEGGSAYYDVVLDRDKASWIVEAVEMYFPSKA